MQASAVMAKSPSSSKASKLAGNAISGLLIAFFIFDAAMKIVKPAPVVDASAHMGLPAGLITPIGAVLLLCVVLYAIPRTAVLGALLLTGYLGGAVFANLRAGDPLFSHVLFPVYFGVLLWGALLLREPRLRELIPLRGNQRNPL